MHSVLEAQTGCSESLSETGARPLTWTFHCSSKCKAEAGVCVGNMRPPSVAELVRFRSVQRWRSNLQRKENVRPVRKTTRVTLYPDCFYDPLSGMKGHKSWSQQLKGSCDGRTWGSHEKYLLGFRRTVRRKLLLS